MHHYYNIHSLCVILALVFAILAAAARRVPPLDCGWTSFVFFLLAIFFYTGGL